jgi:hypothetical protein
MNELTVAQSLLLFERRPAPVLAEHRPLYKICQLLLVLRVSSRGGKSTLPRLHLFNWALKRTDRLRMLVDAEKTKVLRVTAWGFDPAVSIALRYAVAEALIQATSISYQITEKGETLIDEALKDDTVFAQERQLLKEIGKNITESMVDNVAKGWEAA